MPSKLKILLAVFGVVAMAYSLIIPLFEGPDEDDHFRYAKFIADHHALPAQLFEPGGGIAGHQGWQPPLAYTLAALVINPIDTADYEQHLWRNYAGTFVGDPSCCGRNIYYHTDSENFPYTRTTLAVHLARLISVLFGAITVAATYHIAATILESDHATRNTQSTNYLALAAASVVAFNPSFLFASALVSNDAPLAAFSALVLLVWARLLHGRVALNAKTAALTGLILGFAVLTKTTALGLVPLTMLVLLFVAWRARDLRLAIKTNVILVAVFALISGWWFARNWILYGDPLAARLVSVSALFPRSGELTLPELFQISLPWLWQTFWGGPTPGDFAPALLAALGGLTLLAFIGMIVFATRNSRFAIRGSILLLAAWLAFILLAQIQFIRTTTGADQGRYLFPAVSVIALFFVLGLAECLRLVRRILNFEFRVLKGSLAHWLIGAFFLLALYVPLAYTLPAYARPALLAPNDLARIAQPLSVTFGDAIELLGYDLETRAVKPGDTLRIALYWRALAPMSESFRVFVHLVGQGDTSAGGTDVIPARGAFPTVYWKPGDALRDVVSISIAPDAPPGKYALQVGVYPVGKPNARLPVSGSDESHVELTALKIAPREMLTFTPRTRVDANFANEIDLIGYDVKVNPDTLTLTLGWRARRALARDYTVFIHALDARGNIVAQVDRQPQPYPTSLWEAGEVVRDEYVVAFPANARRVILGWYDAATGERLRVDDADHVEIILRGEGQ